MESWVVAGRSRRATNKGEGRAGRSAALLRVGAKIRAHPLDEDFKPYHPDDDKPKVIEPIDPRRPAKRAVIA
jgi:hypothetical protein